MASRLPILALREDFDGEDGALAEYGLEEGLEVFGYGCGGNVGYFYCESRSWLCESGDDHGEREGERERGVLTRF